ncbi:MAG: ABC transporter ATP-binding protein [Chitinophagaceae bacterium]|nr:ABC transporter ATP-binding protein [Oligoflexus sp.]
MKPNANTDAIGSPQIAIEAVGLAKAYGTCISNADVSFKVLKGTIHGILGENGAGKSTAMKILYGLVKPDLGEIWIDGIKRSIHSPQDAKAIGIGMVHQHFMLSEAQTVLENIVLGNETTYIWARTIPEPLKPLNLDASRAAVLKIMAEHNLTVPLEAKIDDLSVGVRQRVEIIKLLYADAKILILDEPTAVLTPQEIQDFFKQLRILAKAGKTILIVTHKLRELLDVTDTISIFRAGRVIETVSTSVIDSDGLATLMIGRRLETIRNDHKGPTSSKPVLTIEDLHLSPAPTAQQSCSLTLFPGEILGIAGIEGNGQAELVEALRHPREFLRGHAVKRFEFLGKDVRHWKTPEMVASGLGCIPADRHHEGLLLDRSAVQNFALGHENNPKFRSGPFLRWKQIRAATATGMDICQVNPRLPDLLLKDFSGGNQQKLIIAREIHDKPRLLIAFHPTRGIDVGAIELLHKKLLELRAEGMAIILISSELEEILALSDRIAVMENYRISRTFLGGRCDETELGLAMSGSHSDREVPFES